MFSTLLALRKARARPERWSPVAVAGARELVPLLARELRAGGEQGAVREGVTRDASVLVWIGKADEDAMREAAHLSVRSRS